MASWGKGQFLAISLLLAVVFTACSGKTEIPEDVLPVKKMTSLMIQVHLIESKVGRMSAGSDSSKVLFDHFEKLMLKQQGVDTALYNRSLKFYTSHPSVFKKVYEAVVDSLMELENRQKLIEEEAKRLEIEAEKRRKAKRDSIKTLSDSLGISIDSLISDSTRRRPMIALDSLNLKVKRYQLKEKLKQ